ncbi:MAG: hypothetical protein HY023_19280 [Chloroflexi bacterium]|nr:hypothetical protein [Chloroflexota bacterium]MBI3761962.1 hypothetical protein [Chloroflexota bacterium]
MNPKQFLTIGGIVLLVLGVLGLVALNQPNSFFWLDTGENVAHIVLGVVALAAVFVPGLNAALMPFYKWIVVLVGVIAVFFGIYGFVVSSAPVPNTFGVANLENPADNILHLVVGAWALYASLGPQATKQAM